MNKKLAWADRLIAVISPDYLPARYSAHGMGITNLERPRWHEGLGDSSHHQADNQITTSAEQLEPDRPDELFRGRGDAPSHPRGGGARAAATETTV